MLSMPVAQTQHEWTAMPQQLPDPLKERRVSAQYKPQHQMELEREANEPFLEEIALTHDGQQMYEWDSWDYLTSQRRPLGRKKEG